MLISIITPTFNSAKTIGRTINSVVQQNYDNFEHILVDNLSSDKTIEIAKSIYNDNKISSKLRIICEKDEGISDAFNKGIRASKGEIIAILNSDDYYFDVNVFNKVINVFRDPNILFTHGNLKFIDDTYGSNIRKPLLCQISKAMPYNHPTMFLKKIIYNKYGYFDPSYKFAMDFELVCRMEKMIPDFRSRGFYLEGDPISIQLAGGASWQYEMNSIKEVKKALIQYQFWDNKAKFFYWQRIFRTRLKSFLNRIGLSNLIRVWRKHKWKN